MKNEAKNSPYTPEAEGEKKEEEKKEEEEEVKKEEGDLKPN